MGLPLPKNFHGNFVKYGYQCLPRQLFIQYVNRGIFILDKDFIEKETVKLTYSWNQQGKRKKKKMILKIIFFFADAEFRFFLLSHLNDRQKSIQLLQCYPPAEG
jgi:hypothetical protein